MVITCCAVHRFYVSCLFLEIAILACFLHFISCWQNKESLFSYVWLLTTRGTVLVLESSWFWNELLFRFRELSDHSFCCWGLPLILRPVNRLNLLGLFVTFLLVLFQDGLFVWVLCYGCYTLPPFLFIYNIISSFFQSVVSISSSNHFYFP